MILYLVDRRCDMNNKSLKSFIRIMIMFVLIFVIISSCFNGSKKKNVFRIIASTSTRNMESSIKKFAKDEGFSVDIDYYGDLEIVDILNENASDYDAVWISNSIWLYNLENSNIITDSKSIIIDPVVLGIEKSKAIELGYVDKDIYNKDILESVRNGDLKYIMSSVTKTNTGATTYLNFLNSLAGNPEVLTSEMLNNDTLLNDLKDLFKGVERVSGDEDYLLEIYDNGNYNAMFNYESTLINYNKKRVSKGLEPLYLVYPKDGVAINDMPIAYINNDLNDTKKKEKFTKLQEYLRSDEMISRMESLGYRSWYGGIKEDTDKSVFNPDWGIDTTKYLKDMKFPSKKVMSEAINLYIEKLRKPTHVVFCLDVSGSMYGEGLDTLKDAMNYILNYETASKDKLQFSDTDKITIITFDDTYKVYDTKLGNDTESVISIINLLDVGGATNIYDTSVEALEILDKDDSNEYTKTVILMTDGMSNVGSFYDLESYYKKNKLDIPIYSITFGDSSEYQLREIALLTNGKVFDGKHNLKSAFKEVRSYN